MFIAKKYIFETRNTRAKRILANSIVIIFLGFILYSVLCGYLLYFAKQENEKAENFLYLTSPDLVVVFTGDGGRMRYGLNLLQQAKATKLFITGVYNANTVKSLLVKNKSANLYEQLADKIEIDYHAKNTVENVIATLHYLRKNKTFKKVLIVSSDYHLSRIMLILNKVKTDDDEFKFYLKGPPSKYNNLRALRIIYNEVFKWIKTFGFLLLWDSETATIIHEY